MLDPITTNFLCLFLVPEPPLALSVKDVGPLGTVEVIWHPPAKGNFDDFEIKWLPRDALLVSKPNPMRRILTGLYPGRAYNISLVTVSGGAPGPVTYSSPVHHTIRIGKLALATSAVIRRIMCFLSDP